METVCDDASLHEIPAATAEAGITPSPYAILADPAGFALFALGAVDGHSLGSGRRGYSVDWSGRPRGGVWLRSRRNQDGRASPRLGPFVPFCGMAAATPHLWHGSTRSLAARRNWLPSHRRSWGSDERNAFIENDLSLIHALASFAPKARNSGRRLVTNARPSTSDAADSVPLGLGSLARFCDLRQVRAADPDWVRPRVFCNGADGGRLNSTPVRVKPY